MSDNDNRGMEENKATAVEVKQTSEEQRNENETFMSEAEKKPEDDSIKQTTKPFEIRTLEDLLTYWEADYKDRDAILCNDIVLNRGTASCMQVWDEEDKKYTVYGYDRFANIEDYNRCFDGNNHTIFGINNTISQLDYFDSQLTLEFDESRPKSIAVFPNLGPKGSIKNLTLTGTLVGSLALGGFVFNNKGTIENCVNKINILGMGTVGGICVYNSGTVRGCKNYGEIHSVKYVAEGICYANSGLVTECENSGVLISDAVNYYNIDANHLCFNQITDDNEGRLLNNRHCGTPIFPRNNSIIGVCLIAAVRALSEELWFREDTVDEIIDATISKILDCCDDATYVNCLQQTYLHVVVFEAINGVFLNDYTLCRIIAKFIEKKPEIDFAAEDIYGRGAVNYLDQDEKIACEFPKAIELIKQRIKDAASEQNELQAMAESEICTIGF